MASKIRIGNEWKDLLKLPNQRDWYAMVAIGNNRIALVGGSIKGEYVDSIDVYNLETKTWSTFCMKEKHGRCAAVAIDEKLFILGGWNGSQCLSSCKTYDTRNQELHFFTQMSAAKAGHAAVVYDNTNVVVLGGRNGADQIFFKTVEMFDTINKNWIRLPLMHTPRNNFAVGVTGSYIVAAGGYNNSGLLNSVEIMNMKNRTWKRVANMNKKRECEIYSFKNNSWSTVPNLENSSRFPRLVVMNGMVIGGEEELETLDLSAPELIYKLVHFAIENDLFCFFCKKIPYKPPQHEMAATKRPKKN